MTVTELAPRMVTAADRKSAAVTAYVDAHRRGEPLTGAELGRQFGMSEGWGRSVRQEALSVLAADDMAAIDVLPTDDEPSTDSDCQIRDSSLDVTERRDRVGTALALFVALIAGVQSYGHLYFVALTAGEPLWLARAFPLSIDVLAVAAYRAGERGRWWMRFAVALSVAGNIGSRFPQHMDDIGPAVAVVPVIVAYGAHSLISNRKES